MISPGNPQHSEVSSHRRNTTGWLVALGAAASSIPLFDVRVRARRTRVPVDQKNQMNGGNIPPQLRCCTSNCHGLEGAQKLPGLWSYTWSAGVCQHSTPNYVHDLEPVLAAPLQQPIFMIIKMASSSSSFGVIVQKYLF